MYNSHCYSRLYRIIIPKCIRKMSNNTNNQDKGRTGLHDTLYNVFTENSIYFSNDDSDSGQRLYAACNSITHTTILIRPALDTIYQVAPSFDFDEKTPGNGYRSFLFVVDACILHGLTLGRQISMSRDSILFRKWYYTKELEACCQLLASLSTCVQYLLTILEWSKKGELFPSNDHSALDLFAQSESINQYCFYGRCLGFQYTPSMRSILKGISVCMAGFSEVFFNKGTMLNSVWAGGKYMIDPEKRAKRIVNLSQNANIEFCKAFWFLAESEFMQKVPKYISTAVSVNKLISIPPESIELKGSDGNNIKISPPTVHIGLQKLTVRLISKVRRKGMVGESSADEPPAKALMFHCHGGGFVAQSSSSHEMYLREWAGQMDIPILSVDYSLAPQAPYPRALEEVFYAYCWALKHADLLGFTGEKIIMVGDSAGANLNMGACLKAITENVPVPTGIMLIYAPLLITFLPSPARLLCLMDPLLPFGFMMRCLKAYINPPPAPKGDENTTSGNTKHTLSIDTQHLEKEFLKLSPLDGPNSTNELSHASSFEEISESDLVELQAHKSPTSDHLSDTISAASLSSDHKTLVTPTNEDKSQQYVSDFLEKYVLESDTDSEGNKIPVLKQKSNELETPSLSSNQTLGDSSTLVPEDNASVDSSSKKESKWLHSRISEAAGNIVGSMSTKFSSFHKSPKTSESNSSTTLKETMIIDDLVLHNPEDEFVFQVPKDPFLSPYWADDELLKKVPPLKVLSVQLDPCLDDCVMFAKKLKNLGNPVHLDVLEGLPHGFLNFSMMNKDAYAGSMLCVKRMQELLDPDLHKPEEDK